MKNTGNKVFFLLIAVFLGLVFAYQYFSPEKFIWRATYDRHDRQPFGSYVFDDIVSSSFGSYRVMNATFFEYYYNMEINGPRTDFREPEDEGTDAAYGEEPVEDEKDEEIARLLEDLNEENGYSMEIDDSLHTDFREPEGEEAAAAYGEKLFEDKEDEEIARLLEELGEENEEEDSDGDGEIYFIDRPDYFQAEYVEPLPPEARRAFLVTDDYIAFSDADMKALMYLLGQGHKVMLCLDNFPYTLCDSLCFHDGRSGGDSPFFYDIERYAAEGYRRDSLFFGTDTLCPERIYRVYPQMHSRALRQGVSYADSDSTGRKSRILCDSLQALVRNAEGDTVALRLFIGEGELFLVATPLMFTNYGMLDGENASYAFRLLSYMKGMPLTRLDAYVETQGELSTSPFRYVLSQPPLRWAFYASLAVILLFMVFTAKRRQRVIPVVRPPANETLRFTRLIGNLYYQKKDCRDMLKKKYLYFSAGLKRMAGLDLQSGERDEELARRLAERMGQSYAAVWPAFSELKDLLRDGAAVGEDEMTRCIDRMNEWMMFLS
ncbi:MAG: hypothetical protein LBK07_00080 [Tannerella sp.]|jgi:hypothetical protein|nr:hypothetical protein [Tannerella sp.]